MPPKFLVIADDLTGALDSSVAFAERGFSVICALAPEHLERAMDVGSDVVALATNTREGSEEKAISTLNAAFSAITKNPQWKDAILFLKVDSRLKGHVAASVAALRPAFAAVRVCPAIPKLQRLVKNGAVCGAGVEQPIAVATTCKVVAQDAPDAITEGDLDSIVQQAPDRTLLVGAAGLAEALARHWAPVCQPQKVAELPAPALFAIGSRDPITVNQINNFSVISAPNGVFSVPTSRGNMLDVVQMTEGDVAVHPADAGAVFAQGIVDWINQFKPETLLACGGESAAAIMRLLGCGLLSVEGEVLTGLPVSTLCDGVPGMRLVTKSGGFGGPDALVQVARKLVNSIPE